VTTPLPDPEQLVRAMADAMRGKVAADAGMVGHLHRRRVDRGAAAPRAGAHDAAGAPRRDLASRRLRRIGPAPRDAPQPDPVPVEGREIVLVDDILHTGRTIRAAINELFDFGRRRPCASP
jgi:pyrimidine operon attenuation protein/uracil phosphoribosyltransferase